MNSILNEPRINNFTIYFTDSKIHTSSLLFTLLTKLEKILNNLFLYLFICIMIRKSTLLTIIPSATGLSPYHNRGA